MLCNQCPRKCGIDRAEVRGFCGAPKDFLIARVALHPWEEPCLTGKNGSGTVFFCGCNLRCVFCQNRDISHALQKGHLTTPQELREMILGLQSAGACNINLVTPTQYARQLIPVLRELRPHLTIPVLYNSGGYESPQVLRELEGLIDIYLPDMKYYDPALAARYSSAPDYPTVALTALREMLRQCPSPCLDSDGQLLRGVMLRHLILPGCRKDSIALLQGLYEEFGNEAFLLSLMSQYTPEFAPPDADRNLHRRLTDFEARSVQETAASLGFRGYLQDRASATSDYTPKFGADQVMNFLKNVRNAKPR